MLEVEEIDRSVWRPKPQQNAKALRSFRDTMDDIRDCLEYRPDAALSVDSIRIASRKVSVSIRKLLLDSVPLMHRVLNGPRLHSLPDRSNLTGDIYKNSFSMQVAPATENGQRLASFAEHTWSITVHPLHGLRFDAEAKRWCLHPLFDAQAQLSNLGTWLGQRLFMVDRRFYSLRDTLKFVANKEALHVDLDRNERSRDMERVHFGHTTYPQLVTVLVASYLLERYRTSLTENVELWNRFRGVSGEAPPDYKIIGGGDFPATDIFPPGFRDEFHDTGIQLPEPGRAWNPVQLREHATVNP